MEDNRKEFDPLNIWNGNTNARKIETITPHKIIVIFLVQEYLKIRSEAEKNGIYSPKYSKRFCLLLLKLIQYPDMSYKDLHMFLSAPNTGIDPKVLKKFDEFMETISSTGVDVLFELQIFIGKLLSENFHVNQFGIVAFHIRRILLTLNKMNFSNIIDLYKNINLYYEKGIRALCLTTNYTERSNITDGNETAGSAAMNMSNESSLFQMKPEKHLSLLLPSATATKDRIGYSKWSVKQADLFIAQQSNLLEKNETAALLPIDLQKRLNEISKDIPFYSQAHILSYMNSLRVRDFYNSIDSFHCAYDRCSSRSLVTGVTNDTNTKTNKGLQYSCLNLAILHVQFGHFEEAMRCLREAIMLAQESGDKICLQIAQSWLCLIDNKYVLPCESSITHQVENSATNFVSLGVQFIVNAESISGALPSHVFELLMKSEKINFQNTLMELVSNCFSQKSAVWQQYGRTELSSLCNQLLLQTFDSSTESVCLSLCHLSLWLALQGEILQCAVILQQLSERFPRDPLSRNWQKIEGYISSQQGIHHCKWSVADRACSRLFIYDKTISILQRATMHISQRNCALAQKYLLQLLNDDKLEPINRVRAMILLANTHFTNDVSNDGEIRFTADVIDILNEASLYAKEKYLAYEAAIADIHTAYVLLDMGMPQQALRLIKNCMELILANGGIYECAKTNFLFVRCLVAVQPNDHSKLYELNETLAILEQCVQSFMKLEVYSKAKDIYIYLAKTFNELGLMKDRNKWSYKYRELEEQFPTSNEYLNVFL